MRGLRARVSLSHFGARFAKAESQLAKEPLALASLQAYLQLLLQETRERFAIPNAAAGQARLRRSLPKSHLHPGPLRRTQTRRPACALAFGQTSKARGFEAMHPILDGARRVAQRAGRLSTAQALRDQQHAVETVIITRFIGPTDFILQSQDHCLRI